MVHYSPECQTCGRRRVKLVSVDAAGVVHGQWCSAWCRKVSDWRNDGCQHPGTRRVGRRRSRSR